MASAYIITITISSPGYPPQPAVPLSELSVFAIPYLSLNRHTLPGRRFFFRTLVPLTILGAVSHDRFGPINRYRGYWDIDEYKRGVLTSDVVGSVV